MLHLWLSPLLSLSIVLNFLRNLVLSLVVFVFPIPYLLFNFVYSSESFFSPWGQSGCNHHPELGEKSSEVSLSYAIWGKWLAQHLSVWPGDRTCRDIWMFSPCMILPSHIDLLVSLIFMKEALCHWFPALWNVWGQRPVKENTECLQDW